MAVQEKKRIQVQVDKELADDTEQVLERLGLTQTTAITMLYKRIVASDRNARHRFQDHD